MAVRADLLIVDIKTLYGLHTLPNEPRRGSAMNELSRVDDAAIACADGHVVEVGDADQLRARFPTAERLSASGLVATPAFVDCHTHPVFDGGREREYEMRMQGASYLEIAESGGGILSSVRGVRAASEQALVDRVRYRLDRFLSMGTTAIEAKSGYGLSLEDELKSLRVLRAASDESPVHLEPTFLGAHEVPPEYRDRRDDYVALVCDEMLPAVRESGLARFCDVFTEGHVFSIEQSRRILGRAKELGFDLRIHADQLTPLGGAELAAEVGAHSADHLDWITEKGIERLAASATIPVLLPGVSHFLKIERDAPARSMIEAGLPVALATDMNPGSCYTFSMTMIMHLSCLRMGLTPAEALTAATLNAAFSAGCADRFGSLHPGKRADLVLWDIDDYRHLPYEFGAPPISQVIAAGRIVYRKGLRDSSA